MLRISVSLLLVLGLWAGIAGATEEDPQISAWIEMLGDLSSSVRAEAREGLLLFGEAAISSLVDACASPSAVVRWEAVNLLGMIGDPRGLDAVLRVATTDPDVHARWRANWALTRVDDGTAGLRLIVLLTTDDAIIAWNAAVALSLFDALEAVPILHAGLDAEGWQQWEAVNALGRVWNDETTPKLIVVLQEGPEDVRKEAALSLGRIGGGEVLVILLVALAEDPSFEVRWRAAMMIGYIGDQETAVLLSEIRAQETHPFVIEHIDEAIEVLTSAR